MQSVHEHKDTTFFEMKKNYSTFVSDVFLLFIFPTMSERTRIKDIAKLAGVSVGTVDRVIHSRSGVSESSKKRVKEILKQLDYQPNMYASALASNKK